MILSLEEVQHIAQLARLELSAEELERYRGQLSAILEYAARLQEVDTDQIEPATGVLAKQARLRADEPAPGLSTGDLLSNAPQTTDNQFRVPSVFDPEP